MNLKQANFYEILDALQVNAYAGEGVFNITNGIKINNGVVKANLKVTGLSIVETDKSAFAIMCIGDLGMVFVAKQGQMHSIYLLDFSNKDAIEYLETEDYRAMLMHVTKEKDVVWVLDIIQC